VSQGLHRTVASSASGEIDDLRPNWLPAGQARRPSGTGWVHRWRTVARCWSWSWLERDRRCLSLQNLFWDFADARPPRLSRARSRSHGRMFGEYAFMEDSCNASPELFLPGKKWISLRSAREPEA